MHVNVHVHVCIHQRAIAVSREACYWLKSFLHSGSIFMGPKKVYVLSPLHGMENSVSSPFHLRVDTVLWKRNIEFWRFRSV